MKTLGLIGGISWFSTMVYYRTINQLVNERLGGAHSAKLLLYSVDFDELKTLLKKTIGNKLKECFPTSPGNLRVPEWIVL
jgi:aspartate racemase